MSFDRFRDKVASHMSRFGATDEILLEFYDVTIRQEELLNLEPFQWFNDCNIAFHYEYIERLVLSHREAEDFILLRPSIGFLIAQTPDPATLKDALPPLSSARFLFCPVNDNQDPNEAEGGSHWSLIVVCRDEGWVFAYDSLEYGNQREAASMARKIGALLGKHLRVLQVRTPQQHNSADCGVYVCMITSYLVKLMLETNDAAAMQSLSGNFEPDVFRREMLRKIEKLMRKSKGRKIGEKMDIEISPDRLSNG